MNAVPANQTPEPAGLPPVQKRRRWLSVLLGLVLFASGLVVGTGGTLIAVRNAVIRAVQHPDESPPVIAVRLKRILKLDGSQTREVEAILRKHQSEFEALRAEVQPRIMKELDQIEQEVAEVLDPQQRAEWHKRFAVLRQTWVPPPPPKGPHSAR